MTWNVGFLPFTKRRRGGVAVGKGGCCVWIGSGMFSSAVLGWFASYLHRLWILSGADLVPLDCIISGRAARSGALVQRLCEADAACSVSEAFLLLPAHPSHRIPERELALSLSVGQLPFGLNPSCFLYTWLMQCLPFEIPAGIHSGAVLFAFSRSGQAGKMCLSHGVLELDAEGA